MKHPNREIVIAYDGFSDFFWGKVEKTDRCWNWKGYVDGHGYGKVSMKHKSYYAHRIALFLSGTDPGDMDVDHLCRNKSCVNPSHLELVTTGENTRRRYGTDICKRGHELSEENSTYMVKNKETGQIGRRCRLCANDLARKRYHLSKEKEEAE